MSEEIVPQVFKNDEMTRGFKAFGTASDGGLMCRTMRYEVGGEYELGVEPELCERGYHFCRRLVDCFGFYDSDSRICEVEASGVVIDGDDGKSVTDHIRIVRELDRHEVLDLANVGKGCTGIWNSGDLNSGNGNSGDWNSGNRNSGDWNKTNFSAGVLCTQEPECLIFDRPSGMTLREWRDSEAADLMRGIHIDADRWICSDDMTEEEKAAHPEHVTTGGFLHHGTGRPDFAGWWARLDDDERAVIVAIPNFDADKWKLITGIEVCNLDEVVE